ncbi:MAG: hypothetical protein ACI4MN_02040 [Candidatus Coproplasma sp.]
MEENIIVSNETSENIVKRDTKRSIGERFKERWRKFLVNLKRNPQRIPLVVFLVTSICWLFWLFTFSKVAYTHGTIQLSGLAIFVNTLLSILILALFLNAFPKRKKPNIIMIILLFVFIAVMIAMDILFFVNVFSFIYIDAGAGTGGMSPADLANEPFMSQSLTYIIAHLVLLGFSAVMLALYPVFKILLPKLNTKKDIAESNLKEAIEVEDE